MNNNPSAIFLRHPNSLSNRPLYNFLLSALAFAIEWKQSWGWPRFDTNLLCFVMEIMLEKYELA